MFKVNNRNTRTRCEICSKVTIKTPERRQTYSTPSSSVSIVNFKQVNAGWVFIFYFKIMTFLFFSPADIHVPVEPATKLEKVLR